VSGARPTAGKRNLQQQKREKAQAKIARKAARRAADPDTSLVPVDASEAELMQQLADLHHAAEAGQVSAQEFEERREHIRKQLEQIEGKQ
jgi:16S rRNA G1207 methylase RsmC